MIEVHKVPSLKDKIFKLEETLKTLVPSPSFNIPTIERCINIRSRPGIFQQLFNKFAIMFFNKWKNLIVLTNNTLVRSHST